MEGRMTNRQKAALETRQRIVEAARRLMCVRDFAEVSIGDIAKEAGTAAGTFYVYFRHKEDVVEELRNHEFLHLAEKANGMSGKGIVERLSWYCREFLAGIEGCGVELCRQWVRNNISPRRMHDSKEDITKYQYDIRAMRSILTQGVADGLLKTDTPVNDLAELINAELYGLMTVWCMSDAAVVGSRETANLRCLFLERALALYLK